eukprot:8280-Heterococcus_DN1.PRE.2
MSTAAEDPNAAGSDEDYDDLFSADLFLDEEYKLQHFTFGDIEQVYTLMNDTCPAVPLNLFVAALIRKICSIFTDHRTHVLSNCAFAAAALLSSCFHGLRSHRVSARQLDHTAANCTTPSEARAAHA